MNSGKAATLVVLSAGGVLVITTLAYLPGFVAGPSFDAAVFGTVGWLAAEGRAPYAEAWDHKPPFIYAINWALHIATSASQWWPTAVLASIAATAGAALLLARMLNSHLTSPLTALIAAGAAAAAMGQYPLSLGGGLTETMAMPTLVGALAIGAVTRRDSHLMYSGALLALAVATSIQVVPGAIAVALLVLMRLGWRRAGVLVVAAAVALFVIIALVVFIGAGPEAFDALVLYATAYRASSSVDEAGPATAALVLLFLIIPALLGAIRLRRLQPQVRTVAIAMLAWLLLSFASFVIIGRFEVHYAVPTVVPLVVLAALALDRLSSRVDRIALPFILVFGLVVSVATSASASAPLVDAYAAENARVGRVAEAVRGLSDAGSSIVVWGLEPQLHTEAQRVPAGRYVYLYPLTTPGYSHPAQIAEELAAWERSRPALIIDAGSLQPGDPGAPALLIPRETDFDGRDLDLLGPFRTFVREHYRLIVVIDGWPLYGRSSLD